MAALSLGCGMWDLVLWPEIEPQPPALESATGSPGSPLWLFYMESQVSFSAHFGPLFTSHLNQHREPRGPRATRGLPLRCLYLWATGGKGGWGKKRGANTSILKLLKDICHICTTKAQFKKKKSAFSIHLPAAAAAPTLNRNLNGCSLFTRRQAKRGYLKMKCSGQITISRYVQTIFMLTHLIELYLYVRFLAAGNSFW